MLLILNFFLRWSQEAEYCHGPCSVRVLSVLVCLLANITAYLTCALEADVWDQVKRHS